MTLTDIIRGASNIAIKGLKTPLGNAAAIVGTGKIASSVLEHYDKYQGATETELGCAALATGWLYYNYKNTNPVAKFLLIAGLGAVAGYEFGNVIDHSQVYFNTIGNIKDAFHDAKYWLPKHWLPTPHLKGAAAGALAGTLTAIWNYKINHP